MRLVFMTCPGYVPLKSWFYAFFIDSFFDGCLDSSVGANEGASR